MNDDTPRTTISDAMRDFIANVRGLRDSQEAEDTLVLEAALHFERYIDARLDERDKKIKALILG